MRHTLLLLGTTVLALLLAGGVALAATAVFENSSTITIDSDISATVASPYPSQSEVSGLSTGLEDVNLTLMGYSHEFPDDVGVLLVGPKGQTALVMSDVGNQFDVNFINLTLDDEAQSSLPDGTQLTAGTFKPTQGTNELGNSVPVNFPSPAPTGPYGTQLSAFDGTDPNGTWSLYVLDDSEQDVGLIASGWSLEITTADTQAPKVISTFPRNGGEVGPAANVTATFSEDMQESSVKNALKLFKKGSTNQISAQVSYDAATDTATLNPTNNLRRGVTYKAVVTTVAKDVVGNRLDQDDTTAGLQQKVWFFEVD